MTWYTNLCLYGITESRAMKYKFPPVKPDRISNGEIWITDMNYRFITWRLGDETLKSYPNLANICKIYGRSPLAFNCQSPCFWTEEIHRYSWLSSNIGFICFHWVHFLLFISIENNQLVSVLKPFFQYSIQIMRYFKCDFRSPLWIYNWRIN